MGADCAVHVLHDPDPTPPARSSRLPSPRSSASSRSRRPPASSSSASRVLPPGEVAHRSAKGFVSEDEFLSIPEFSTNRSPRTCTQSIDIGSFTIHVEPEYLYEAKHLPHLLGKSSGYL
uniref:Uncharacterized protein n=1 Tax=Triticum urartu TaxID=4572 RepID=A0A8R7VIP9_TRIUA